MWNDWLPGNDLLKMKEKTPKALNEVWLELSTIGTEAAEEIQMMLTHTHTSKLCVASVCLIPFGLCLIFCVCVLACLVSNHWTAVKSSWAQRWCTAHPAWTSPVQWPWPSLTVLRLKPRTGTFSSREEPRTANGRWELQAHTCQLKRSPSRS